MTCIYNIAISTKLFKLYGGYYNLKPYNINDSIQDLIFKYRINNNLSLKDLSFKLNYSVSYLCNLENGTILPNKKLIEAIYSLTLADSIIKQ
ncbi:helix-turn-helix transcriptional regulator, partial [Clostridium sp. CCUG 7971]|uniref:helix-turn-helix domain-containing protein n=1 Tax=Clostridium sp. CCUG 7971 TaxID=2811414 RepID=UPI001ABA8554|nr:helix-turn-helix transcriptional regulator [Clostridium sp. CCUG 7971]